MRKIKLAVSANFEKQYKDSFMTPLLLEDDLSVYSYANGKDLLVLFEKIVPDVIIIDDKIQEIDGIDTFIRSNKPIPRIKLIGLYSKHEDVKILKLLNLGVNGFVDKGEGHETLIKAISIVNKGGQYIPERTYKLLQSHLRQILQNIEGQSKTALSDAQKTVLDLTMQGLSSKENWA